jgi:aminoglycoside 6-adenylyltransferase
MSIQRDVLREIKLWAEETPEVRAIILTGSRADPDRSLDDYSDFDIEVFVSSVRTFVEERSWISRFGNVLVRWPPHPAPTGDPDWTTQLIQYDDGVRIDFQFTERHPRDGHSLAEPYRLIVDKEGFADQLPPSLSRRPVTPPTAQSFYDRVNAFWWDSIYVAKALYRRELNYARYMLDYALRFEIAGPLLKWHIGCRRGWDINVGIYGRFLAAYLDEPVWELYKRTFASADTEENWTALFAMVDLVHLLGIDIARAMEFEYDSNTDREVTVYIRKIRHDRPE